ncbi:anthrone oxygenase family protein [Nonomuraea sp. NPDC049784]|uniref:anthrone oxygenase family protein n=1 Tax=Nonomuraea sp. NPDC049784 TaxID=3154361 RepID=UPI0033FB0C43
MDVLAAVAAILALVLNGLMAGLYFAFSTAVTPALDAIDQDHAADAMRSVNRKILNPRFLPTFTLSPVVALVAGILLLLAGAGLPGVLAIAAALAGFLGSIVVTAVVNVPLNNALDAGSVDWPGYSPRWTRWNSLRGWSCAIAVALLGMALYLWN